MNIRDQIINGTFKKKGCYTFYSFGEDYVKVKCFDMKTRELRFKRMVRVNADPENTYPRKPWSQIREEDHNQREAVGEFNYLHEII